jgi:competence protein ComEA
MERTAPESSVSKPLWAGAARAQRLRRRGVAAALVLAFASVHAMPVPADTRAPIAAAAAREVTSPVEKVNINTADAAELARVLQGIGEAKANAIVEYRKANGEFVDLYELANVKGVGERTVELNEDRILLKD